jgi:hypothetical protein
MNVDVEAQQQQLQQQQATRRTGERVAFNDDIFRKANEEIRDHAEKFATHELERLPFICECAEESCTQVLQVPRDEYERIRLDPRLFINAPGHDAAAQGCAVVVEHHDGYVAEKLGRAGEIVEMLDDDGKS